LQEVERRLPRLSNIVWAPIKDGLDGISLSANWMWACKTKMLVYTRLLKVVLILQWIRVNIPTGKIRFLWNKNILGNCTWNGHYFSCWKLYRYSKVVEPVLQRDGGSIYYINLSQDEFKLGGSSFAQTLNTIGKDAPTIKMLLFSRAFNIQINFRHFFCDMT
jgi:phosphoribosylformylglycinamidine synthase